MLDPRAPETRPKSAGAGAKMHPRVCSRAGFFQSRGFACGRVFAKPAPAPAGAIPSSKTHHKKPCLFFCSKCCAKCLCVPPGTYGNKETCPCYNNWKTKKGGPKCP